MSASNGHLGTELASRLGLTLKAEGHDLVGPCVACSSSDAFRLHQEKGVAHCFSCNAKWSPCQLISAVIGNNDHAKALARELGILKGASSQSNSPAIFDPLGTIAKQKNVTPESLQAYGASVLSTKSINFPQFGPEGKKCSTYVLTVDGGKGMNAKGKPAGLFFPHVDGKVRLPKPGETWHLVEGPKDAAALHSLGVLACGMNTCRLAAKFGRLFKGVDIIMVPDRDRTGEEGAAFSARTLRGHAKSVRIAVLPAECKESGGDDVRDILKRPEGRGQVLQAITDAKAPETDGGSAEEGEAQGPPMASAEVAIPEGDPIKLEVSPAGGKPQRLVVATRGAIEHRDKLNTDSSRSRDQFIKKLATKLSIDFAALASLIEKTITDLATAIDKDFPSTPGESNEEPSQATIAALLAAEWERWHTPGDQAFVTLPMGDRNETWPIRSQTFKKLLSKRFFDEQGSAINSESLSAAINLIEAQALFEGECLEVYVRVANHGGKIYLDLCDDTWRVVEITPRGWSVIEESPVRFKRNRGMLALPEPVRGSRVDLLRDFLNVDESTWVLIVCWLIAAMRQQGPYPLLALFAEQGCGKSTIGRFLRALIDPNSSSLRAEPKDARDLMITATNSWCIAFDNLSYIPSWLSDALCRLSTGGGFSTRELYSDNDEIIFESQRPVILTSIEEVATRSDLLDRCLVVCLAPIPDDRRRTEAELNNAFAAASPKILGALLDAVVVALNRLPTTKLATLPRMADFAMYASAAETGLGWSEGTFMRAYQRNRENANDVALDASPIAGPLLELLETQGEWAGTLSELLQLLEGRAGESARRAKGWPKNAASLSGHLKRMAPNLREKGWNCEKGDRTSSSRTWSIRRIDAASSSASFDPDATCEPSPDDECESMPSDADECIFDGHDARDANDAISRTWNPDRF